MKGIHSVIAIAIMIALLLANAAGAQESDDRGEASEAQTAEETQPSGETDDAKTLAGMSILGNEETPKSLVIVPWKSSEMGDELSLSDNLDDRARPVDKEVFLRELRFYEIRAGK